MQKSMTFSFNGAFRWILSLGRYDLSWFWNMGKILAYI